MKQEYRVRPPGGSWGPWKDLRDGFVIPEDGSDIRFRMVSRAFKAILEPSEPPPPPPPSPVDGDGSEGAFTTGIQFPFLLDDYEHSPPWQVAGVDYPVGIPDESLPLKNIATTSIAGVSVTDGAVNVSLPNTVLDGFDMGGRKVFILDGANRCTIRRNRFIGGGVDIQAIARGVRIENNEFTNPPPWGRFINYRGGRDGEVYVQYNYFFRGDGHVLELTQPPGYPTLLTHLRYRYNLIRDMGFQEPAAHVNYLQCYDGNMSDVQVMHNTVWQTRQDGAGEGFQTTGYGNMTDCQYSRNTLLAIGDDNIKALSYIMHLGPVGRGVGVNCRADENYFDKRGAFGAFYGSNPYDFTTSGNVDMVTGESLDLN